MYSRLWLPRYCASLVTNISLPSEGFQPTEKPGIKEELRDGVQRAEGTLETGDRAQGAEGTGNTEPAICLEVSVRLL